MVGGGLNTSCIVVYDRPLRQIWDCTAVVYCTGRFYSFHHRLISPRLISYLIDDWFFIGPFCQDRIRHFYLAVHKLEMKLSVSQTVKIKRVSTINYCWRAFLFFRLIVTTQTSAFRHSKAVQKVRMRRRKSSFGYNSFWWGEDIPNTARSLQFTC